MQESSQRASGPDLLCLNALLDAGNYRIMIDQFPASGLSLPLLDFTDKPCVIIQEAINCFLQQVRRGPAGSGGELLQQRFFLRSEM
jgi:hypothetical protein